MTKERYYELKEVVKAKGENEILTYEEAYTFAMMNYNKGGDSFVECCEEKEFDKIESWGDHSFRVWENTKKTLADSFDLYEDIRRDRMGW